MDLKEPIKKRFQEFGRRSRLPVIVGSGGIYGSEARLLFTGLFDGGGSVVVADPEEMVALYTMGYFGKGSLSRSFPGFGKYKQGIPPLIKERQWNRRKEWAQRLLENTESEEPMDVDKEEGASNETKEKSDVSDSGNVAKPEEHDKQMDSVKKDVTGEEGPLDAQEIKETPVNDCRQDSLSEKDALTSDGNKNEVVENEKTEGGTEGKEENKECKAAAGDVEKVTSHLDNEATVESGEGGHTVRSDEKRSNDEEPTGEDDKQPGVTPDEAAKPETTTGKSECTLSESVVTSTDAGEDSEKRTGNGKDPEKDVETVTSEKISEVVEAVPSCSSRVREEDLPNKGSEDLVMVRGNGSGDEGRGRKEEKDCVVISEDEEVVYLSENEMPCPAKRRKLQEAKGGVLVVEADSDCSQDAGTKRKEDNAVLILDSDCSQDQVTPVQPGPNRGDAALVILDSDCSQDHSTKNNAEPEITKSGYGITVSLDSDSEEEAAFRNRNRFETGNEVMVAEDSDGYGSDSEGHPVVRVHPERVKTVCEHLALALEEAFFLSYGLGCLEVLDPEGEALSIPDMWEAYRRAQEDFVEKYVAYHYFRAKGWVVKPGLKFGGDFLLYKCGPPHYHASYVVLVDAVNSGYRRSAAGTGGRKFSWEYQMGLCRMAASTHKEILFCQVRWPEIDEEEMKSPQVLRKFKVSEKLLRRWIPSEERETDL